MIRTIRLAGLAASLLIVFGCSGKDDRPPGTDWQGVWQYEALPSLSAGGSPITMRYELVVAKQGAGMPARLVIRGFQTDDTLLCNTNGTPHELHVLFRSYSNGGLLNVYGVPEYRPGEQLILLSSDSDRPDTSITTEWRSITPPGESMARKGVYFRKVSK